jgi:hypothetical protein
MLGWRSRTRGGRDVAAAPRPEREVSRELPPVAPRRPGVGASPGFRARRGRGARLGAREDEPTGPIEGTLAQLPDTARLRGPHLYTFKQAASTERWRRGRPARRRADRAMLCEKE